MRVRITGVVLLAGAVGGVSIVAAAPRPGGLPLVRQDTCAYICAADPGADEHWVVWVFEPDSGETLQLGSGAHGSTQGMCTGSILEGHNHALCDVEGETEEELVQQLSRATASELAALLKRNADRVQINESRKMIQILDCTGNGIAAQVPLTQDFRNAAVFSDGIPIQTVPIRQTHGKLGVAVLTDRR